MNHNLLTELAGMSIAELREVNALAVDLIKNKRKLEGAIIKANMKVGDKVKWTGRDGEEHTGTISKMNRTKAQVDQQDIQGRGSLVWTIPFTVLSKVESFNPTTGEWE